MKMVFECDVRETVFSLDILQKYFFSLIRTDYESYTSCLAG